MRGVVAVAVALLVSLMSSGCFVADDDPGTDSDTTGTSTVTATSTGTTTSRTATTTSGTSGAANQAPTANLTATPVNGTAPLNVTFDVAGSDADSDVLTWTLTLDNETLGSGNGTTLPGNVTHQFTEAGNHTVVLVVSDGRLNATANVTIVVAAAGDAAAGAAGPNICEAPSETSIGGEMYVDRVSWIFLESNGLPGLQYTAEPSLTGEVDSAGVGCENGDTLLF